MFGFAFPAMAAPDTGAESSLVKVQPQSPVSTGRAAKISAARNEFESFQISVKGPATVTGVTASPLTGPGGATISADQYRFFKEALLNVTKPSGAIGKTGQWPDALVPAVDDYDHQPRNAFPLDVPAGETRAIWVDLLVPQTAAPGQYTGQVTVTGADGTTSVPVELEVFDFALPSTPSLATAFRASPNYICLAHTGARDCQGDNNVAAQLMYKYAKLGVDNRLTFSNIFVQTWGPGVPVLGKNGEDWSQFDATFGKLLNGTSDTLLPGAKMTSVEYGWKYDAASLQSYVSHAKAQGWFDRLFDYTADEPPLAGKWEDIAPRKELLKTIDPAFRTLVTTNIDEATGHGVTNSIDIMVPIVNHMESPWAPYQGDQRPKYDGYVGGGKTLWMYESCMSQGCSFGGNEPGTAWPSYMVDVSAGRNRVMQWADYLYGVTGELYYESVHNYDRDIWTDTFDFNGNGDGSLLYPGTPARIGGTTNIPVASIRIKQIRDGVEDFEYLKLLEKYASPAEAKALAREALPASYKVNEDGTVIATTREKLARAILAKMPAELRTPEGKAPTGTEQPITVGGPIPGVPSGTDGTPGVTDNGAGGDAPGSSTGPAQGCSTTGGGFGLLALPAAALGLMALRRRRKALVPVPVK